MSYHIIEDGHVSSPLGFRATGVSCGLKEKKARDLALVYSVKPAQAAAVLTTNAIPAAPIFFNQVILTRNREAIRAVLINAGHANAGTGPSGLVQVVECAKLTAIELEVPRDGVLIMSTGKIGVSLPMDRIKAGIRRAVSELDSGGGRRAASAILTTDTRPKERALSVSLGDGSRVTVAGMVKGGGVAHPRPATLLCILTTDVAIDSHLLMRSLEHSVNQSFDRLEIDGETSPNDGVIILANGSAANPPITNVNTREYGMWQEALNAICADLAQQVVRDTVVGGKFVQVHVCGAANEASARQIATAVARSPSVRWACARAIPDWGSLLVAVGASGVALHPELLELRLGQIPVMLEGLATPFDPIAAIQVLSGNEIEIVIDLHHGIHSATKWTCTGLDEC